MSHPSFNEFPAVNKDDWETQVLKDLKGKDFEKTLVWESLEGFKINPYYAEEDLKNIPLKTIQNTQNTKRAIGWQNRILVNHTQEKETNLLIINIINKGVDAIIIDFNKNNIDEIDFIKLLDKVKLSETPIYFKTQYGLSTIKKIEKFIHYQPKGGIIHDSLANFFSGTNPSLNNDTWENTKKMLVQTSNFPSFNTITVESHVFHNAGATASQELAFTLSSAITYLDKVSDKNLTIEQIITKLEFSISIGTNYFLEIAKLRALKYLWIKICKYWIENQQSNSQLNSLNLPTHHSLSEIPIPIHCQTSTFYDSNLSPHTNIIRATTEAMSAVIGGCNSLTIHTFDSVSPAEYKSDISDRIARNISILIKEESHLGITHDPSAGAYFLENLTNNLIENAWHLLMKIEEKGGIIEAFNQGYIQSEIEKSYQDKLQSLQNGKVLVGVNKFRSESENYKKSEKEALFDSHFLPNRRIAEVFE